MLAMTIIIIEQSNMGMCVVLVFIRSLHIIEEKNNPELAIKNSDTIKKLTNILSCLSIKAPGRLKVSRTLRTGHSSFAVYAAENLDMVVIVMSVIARPQYRVILSIELLTFAESLINGAMKSIRSRLVKKDTKVAL
jgi:hypothetical protein